MNSTGTDSLRAIATEDTAPRLRAIPGLPDNAIEITNLGKTYHGDRRLPPKVALNDVSLTIPRGAFFGLLGPNGAGKSTLINILAGPVIKTSGEVRIWDYDIDRDGRTARAAIGVVPQEPNIDPHFTPREILDLQAGMYGVPKAERRTWEALEAVGLTEQAEAYTRTLSGGERRRLLIAKAILHQPPVLVLDEPTAGVDVELRRHLWDHMKELNANGTTILLTTHYLEEAEKLCDTIAIINHGKLVACDATSALLRQVDSKELVVTFADNLDAVPEALLRFEVELLPPRRLAFHYRMSATQVSEIISAIQNAGLIIADLSTEEGNLEDVFLELTRAPAPDPEADPA